MNEGNICLADCATTYTIFLDKRYFLDLTLTNANVYDAPKPGDPLTACQPEENLHVSYRETHI